MVSLLMMLSTSAERQLFCLGDAAMTNWRHADSGSSLAGRALPCVTDAALLPRRLRDVAPKDHHVPGTVCRRVSLGACSACRRQGLGVPEWQPAAAVYGELGVKASQHLLPHLLRQTDTAVGSWPATVWQTMKSMDSVRQNLGAAGPGMRHDSAARGQSAFWRSVPGAVLCGAPAAAPGPWRRRQLSYGEGFGNKSLHAWTGRQIGLNTRQLNMNSSC